jgi:hypothetical protein
MFVLVQFHPVSGLGHKSLLQITRQEYERLPGGNYGGTSPKNSRSFKC